MSGRQRSGGWPGTGTTTGRNASSANGLRALWLAAIVVASTVSVATAFVGAAAAANDAPAVDSAVEHAGNVELVTNQSVEPTAVEIELDGETVVNYDGGSDTDGIHGDTGIGASGDAPFSEVDVTGSSGEQRHSVRLEDGSDDLVDIDPTRDLDITFTYTTGGGSTGTMSTDVTLTSDVVSEGDGNADQGDAVRIYQGADIAVKSNNTDTGVFIPQTGQDLATGQNSKLVTIDSDKLDAGADYEVEFDDDDTEWFSVRDLQLSASADYTSYTVGDTIDVDVSANHGDEPLTAVMENDDGDVVAQVTRTLGGDGTTTLSFDSADNDDITPDDGPYTVTVTDNSTTTATTEPIDVTEPGASTVSLDRDTYREQRGDVAAVNITLSNTDTATVTVGDVAELNWAQTVTVTDGDGDGTVTLEFNTYTAGSGAYTNANGTAYTVYSVADASDSITNVRRADGGFDHEAPAEATLAAEEYPVRVVAGTTPAAETSTGPDDTATLSLEAQSTDALTNYVAPSDRDIEHADDVAALRANGTVTEASTVAAGDQLVVGIEASGLQGVLRNRTTTSADNATAAFLNERPGSGGDENAAFDARITVTDPDVNFDLYDVTLAPNNSEVVADPANDTYWLVVDTAGVPEFSAGDELETNFSVLENGGLAGGSTEEVTDEWSLVERSVTLETNADVDDDGIADEIAVRNASGQAFTGTTTAAPGSELHVTVQTLPGQEVGFFEQLTPTVESDGTFTATANLSGGGVGTNFEVRVRHPDGQLDTEVDGRVVRPLTAADRSYSVSSTDTLSVPAWDGVLATGNWTGATPTASLDGEPSSGTLALRPNGSFEYEPDDGFTGVDSFTYEIVDGVGNADTGTVTIDVESQSDDGGSSDSSDGSTTESREVDDGTHDVQTIRESFDTGGGVPVYAERDSSTRGESERDVVTFSDDAPVERIAFEDDVYGESTVVEYDRLPMAVASPPGQPLRAFRVSVPDAAVGMDATVRARVSASLLDATGIDEDDVALLAYDDGDWERVAASVDSGGDEVSLDGDLDDASFLVVTAVGEPDASAHVAPSTVEPGQAVTLYAGDSVAEYGEISEYEWAVDGRRLAGETANLTLNEPGEYDVELTVATGANETASATATVTVEEDEGTATPSRGDASDTTAATTTTVVETETQDDESTPGDMTSTIPSAPSPGDTDATTDTTVNEGGPGFGLIVTLVVLVAIALVAHKRRQVRRSR